MKKMLDNIYLCCYNSTQNQKHTPTGGDVILDVMGITSNLLLYILLSIAVVQDFRQTKISNRLILSGIFIGFLLTLFGRGADHIAWILLGIILPVIFLYIFYLMGVLGAGDIKLFSMLGTFLNLKQLLASVLLACIFGAIISFIKLCQKRQLFAGIARGIAYFYEIYQGGRYAYSYKNQDNIIHFSVAILLGVMAMQIIGV